MSESSEADLLRACRVLARLVAIDNNGPLDEIALVHDNDVTDEDLAALRRVIPLLEQPKTGNDD